METTEKSEEFEVFPENWETVVMWSRVCTQWRTSMSGAIGLDYSVLQWLFSLYEVKNPREMLEDLQVMEGAFLDYKSRQGD